MNVIQIIPILANNIYFSFFLVLSVYSQKQWGRNRKLSYLNWLGGLLSTSVPSRIGAKLDQRTSQITKRELPLSRSVCINKSNSLEESPPNHTFQAGIGEVEVAGSGPFSLSGRGKEGARHSCPRSRWYLGLGQNLKVYDPSHHRKQTNKINNFIWKLILKSHFPEPSLD